MANLLIKSQAKQLLLTKNQAALKHNTGTVRERCIRLGGIHVITCHYQRLVVRHFVIYKLHSKLQCTIRLAQASLLHTAADQYPFAWLCTTDYEGSCLVVVNSMVAVGTLSGSHHSRTDWTCKAPAQPVIRPAGSKTASPSDRRGTALAHEPSSEWQTNFAAITATAARVADSLTVLRQELLPASAGTLARTARTRRHSGPAPGRRWTTLRATARSSRATSCCWRTHLHGQMPPVREQLDAEGKG